MQIVFSYIASVSPAELLLLTLAFKHTPCCHRSFHGIFAPLILEVDFMCWPFFVMKF